LTSALRAILSAGALGANAAEAVRRAGEGAVADLRRDAWGYGADVVAEALARAGARAARADEQDADAVRAAGLTVTDAAPTLDGRLLLGLPGGDGDPAMRLTSRVLSLKRLRAGEGVSYGYTHRAAADTRIALVAGGYGQGIVRALGNRASVEVGGLLRPIVGRVAMDVCVVDVGDAPIAPGDEVILFGGIGPAHGALAEWEAATGLLGAELVCAIAQRVAIEVEP
jgi:alanine racemase